MDTKETSKKEILSSYMEYVLENGKDPISIYKFSKELNIDEKEFYNHYNSFEHIKNDVYITFHNETHRLISNDESYISLDAKNKLLLYYYTLFELLTANRSFILIGLNKNHDLFLKVKSIQNLKPHFKKFISNLEIETVDFKKDEINKISQQSLEEIAWKQFLFTFHFWIEDTSAAFEKTDLFIEKSVNASFDLLDIPPIKNLIDFGKFILKERLKTSI